MAALNDKPVNRIAADGSANFAAKLLEKCHAFVASASGLLTALVYLRWVDVTRSGAGVIVIDMESAIQCIAAIRTGDTDSLNKLLGENPVLVKSRTDGQRTLLHVATDWPGHFPNVRASVAALVSHGADVNAAFVGRHSERPLHWAASSDDVVALDALLDHGADIEAPGGVIGGGTPLADAVAFGQWRAAQRLVERGARTSLW